MTPIEFTVIKDFEVYENFIIFSLFKSKRYRTAKTTFFLPFLLMIPLAVILLLLDFPTDLPIFLLAIALFTLAVFGFLFFILPKIQYKKLTALFTAPQAFAFYDTYFEVSQQASTASGFSKIGYCELTKAYETHNAFYLFISSNQAFPIPKKALAHAQCMALENVLKTNLEPKKYKTCYKKP